MGPVGQHYLNQSDALLVSGLITSMLIMQTHNFCIKLKNTMRSIRARLWGSYCFDKGQIYIDGLGHKPSNSEFSTTFFSRKMTRDQVIHDV